MKFSILTATYNRANYLERLYKSILNNLESSYDVEWLIMDDGSTDNTSDVIAKLGKENKLEIKYFKQENMGKMAAINNLAKYVTGELWIECDSDDYFESNVFKKIKNNYDTIKNDKDIYALAYLKYDENGNNMGNLFKKDKTTMFDLYFKEGETGEKTLVFISDIRKNYSYKLEKKERFITEARLYHEMDLKYKICCYNIYVMKCEYQKDGYSKNISKQFMNNPYGYYEYFYEILNNMNMKGVLLNKRIYAIKHLMLFAYLTNNKTKVRGFYNNLIKTILYIPGRIKSKLYKSRDLGQTKCK